MGKGKIRQIRKSGPVATEVLVATGVILCGYKHQPGTSRFGLRGTAERGQDPKNDSIGSEDSEAH